MRRSDKAGCMGIAEMFFWPGQSPGLFWKICSFSDVKILTKYMFLIDWRITLVIILVQILVRFLLLSYIIKLRLVCIKLNVVFYKKM